MLEKILLSGGVVSVILLIVLLQTTSPGAVGPLGILIVFILMYLSLLSIISFALFGLSAVLRRLFSFLKLKKPISGLSFTRAYYFSSVIALGPVMLLAIQSVGKLGFYDVLLTALFVLISCVYVAKRTK